jgi:methylenetetrahydrofolate reductase (NADPH)
VLALRGDPQEGPRADWTPTDGGLNYAVELVELARARGSFRVGVAAFPEGHPSAESLDHDADVLVAKARAGAEFAVTQMFFRASDYFGLVERARDAGIDIPIIPGIMPILNLNSMRKMVELSGREMPDEVLERIEPLAEDPAAVRAEGIRIATELCDALLAGGAPGLHFYTLNRSRATREIYTSLACHA